MAEPSAVEVSVHVAAEPATVFPYFTDPARYVRWMGRTATLHPVPGGTYRVCMRDGAEVIGEFLEIDPPHKLAFTWGWSHQPAVPPGSTLVVVTLTPEGGGTRVVLRHYGLPDGQHQAGHRKGWITYLDRLNAHVTVTARSRT
jgi:uncharacterized protein YndB with AHSA1/START domain